MLTKKDYCDYETCVALKELGYNQYTSLRSYAGKGGVRLWDFDGEPNYKEGELIALSDMYGIPSDGNEVAAPSLYEAQKWLREEKGIIVRVIPIYEERKLIKGMSYTHEVIYWTDGYVTDECIEEYTSYEEALSEGVKASVKILKENETIHE